MDHRNSSSRLSRSLRAALLSVMAFFAILAASITAAAEEGDYKPPPGDGYTMSRHLAWCAEGKTAAARIKRYESFWDLQSPKEPYFYDDMNHVRLARRCAYRLAELYAQAGRKKDCLEMLKFLEKEDELFKPEKED
ncbi:MAG TPA: hypothetical protein VK581_11665 [Chthoniobacterales bacterium]|nr:hypothetical protein [Chthoniobacterales bacterium]